MQVPVLRTHGQEGFGSAFNPVALMRTHGRQPRRGIRARLHFDDRQSLSPPRDEIDLSHGRAHATTDDPITFQPQQD